MARSDWNRATKNNPCPVCGGPDNCTISTDGGAVWCGRVADGAIRQNRGGQWLHIRREGQQQRQAVPHEPPPPRRDPESPQSKTRSVVTIIDWPWQTHLTLIHPHLSQRREELADRLGVSLAALERLRVGWAAKYDCWTFPERDATEQIIGLSRRYPDGSKKQWPGGKRGLTYARDWQSDPGAVFLVEGGSDTAAMLSIGLCAIGRPSNTGGIQLLTELLTGLPDDRDVFVVGENDRKPHESLSPSIRDRHSPYCDGCSTCWPGQYGAMSTAGQLADGLRRPVEVIFPPDGSKDVRDLIRQLKGEA